MWIFGGSSKPTDTDSKNSTGVVGVPTKRPQAPAKGVSVDPAGYFPRYGYPIPVHDLESRQEYVSCYNRALRAPSWVIEHLTPQSRTGGEGVDRSKSHFMEDTAIPQLFRARLGDYFRSGYDRGHMAPAANAKFNQNALNETFYLTNMSPQVGEGFNRDYWAHFERFVRNLTSKYASVRVVTGPLYLPRRDKATNKWVVSYEVIGNPPNVAVPTHFFKILIGEDPILPSLPRNGVAVSAFVLPNEKISNSTPLESFAVPVNAIERAVGAEFMPKLPEKNRRDMCKEITCAVEVVEFNDAVKSLPPPRK